MNREEMSNWNKTQKPQAKKDRLAFDRLKIENEELRKSNSRHLEVYRDQALELIDLRTKLAMVRQLSEELYAETS